MYSAPAPFGTRTPPALFTPLFGLFGLALAWRRAGQLFGFGAGPGDLILGVVTAIFALGVLAYGGKLLRRPAVVAEDLRILPGRAGLAAASLSVSLLSAGLAPVMPGAALALFWLGLGLHAALAAAIIVTLVRGPAEQRMVTPVWHLSFVGFIVPALAAAQLGLTGIATALWFATMPVAAGIWLASLRQLSTHVPPPPLRPLLAIHLAPACLFGTVALGLGQTGAAMMFGGLGLAIFAMLVASGRWIVAAGFTPFWSAFTFPLSALAGLCLGLASATGNAAFTALGAALLAAATVAVPVIAYRVMKLWAGGQLAVRTNAAQA